MGNCISPKDKNKKKTESFVRSRLKATDLKKQYNIELKPLGEGSFGKVFRACNKSDNSVLVAIKVINKHGMDEDDLLSISREVSIM